MAGLADGEAFADVGAGDETQRADEGGGAVGEDVAVQVGGDDDVVELRLAEQLVHHAVDDLLLDEEAGVGEAGGRERLLGAGAEEPVRLRQHVGLVGDGDEGLVVDARDTGVALALLVAAQGDLAGHGGDARRRAGRDALDGLGVDGALGRVAVRLLLFHVEVLGVLAHDDHVDGLRDRGERLDGPHVGVEVELLAEGDLFFLFATRGAGG